MTNNAINAFRATEEARHNLVTEQQNQQSILENMRHNRAYEAITEQGNKLHYQSAIYAADRAYQSSVYSANINASTQRYVAGLNAANQYKIAQLNSETGKFTAQTHANATVTSSRISAKASRYSTDIGAISRGMIAKANNRNQLIITGLNHLNSYISSGGSSAKSLIGMVLK